MTTPKFAQWVENTVASAKNPTRRGMFVRTIYVSRGRMNAGTWWECTDGHGEFWQVKPDNCVILAHGSDDTLAVLAATLRQENHS